MDPWPQGWVEEFLPLVPDVEHERLAKEEVFESEAGSNSLKLKRYLQTSERAKSDCDPKQL